MYPSILNEVIGPVMRGPSSSHCAAAVRIGTLVRALMDNDIRRVVLGFDEKGSLAATHESQGSDMGFCGGILGYSPDDERLTAYKKKTREAGIEIEYRTGPYGDPHPNTFRINLENSGETRTVKALSTGGGMIELIEIDGCPISFKGDCCLTLVYFTGEPGEIGALLEQDRAAYTLLGTTGNSQSVAAVKSRAPLDPSLVDALTGISRVSAVKQLPAVLPILTPEKMDIPFDTAAGMIAYSQRHNLDLGELALEYECRRGDTTRENVIDQMVRLVTIMKSSVKKGLAGTTYRDRILHQQSDKLENAMGEGRVLDLGMMNRITLYVTALMEVKSAMGVLVAAPTAGSCGGLPGALIGASDTLGCDTELTARSMLAAGVVGALIAKESTFAAEECGCQAECGAGSGMAAAGLVTLMGGSCETALSAASMALQNVLGMVCDPVAGRVEVPCLGKNIMAAANAVTSANLALAGFDQVIPLDEVIAAMDEAGRKIDPGFRCTATAGLSVSPASRKIERELKDLTENR
ncbi:MAG: L-serine ammonia-lyase, iron-sulfur-dependent, subunit alpha [Desulfobacterales bacterium]|nr:L-serine ammonia-lyase, iron-sulfur-dependent, subunit alpha [Desulfobacterales bacterium]